MTDGERFRVAMERISGTGAQSIGTQAERALHRTVKYFLEPDEEKHEVPVAGFVADVFRAEQGRIFEIQTRDFGRLREKLAAFLKDYRVTVVYPVLRTRYLLWIDPETGEVLSRRKSPKTGSILNILPELSALRDFLGHPSLSFLVILSDGEEYRLADGWSRDGKRGSHGLGKTPFEFAGMAEVTAESLEKELREAFRKKKIEADVFSRKELASALGLGTRGGMKLGFAVRSLEMTGVIVQCGKKGNSFLYKWKNEISNQPENSLSGSQEENR